MSRLGSIEGKAKRAREESRRTRQGERNPVPDSFPSDDSTTAESAKGSPTAVPGVKVEEGSPIIVAVSLPADSSWIENNDIPEVKSQSSDRDLEFGPAVEAEDVSVASLWEGLNDAGTLSRVSYKTFTREDGTERARIYIKFRPGGSCVTPQLHRLANALVHHTFRHGRLVSASLPNGAQQFVMLNCVGLQEAGAEDHFAFNSRGKVVHLRR